MKSCKRVIFSVSGSENLEMIRFAAELGLEVVFLIANPSLCLMLPVYSCHLSIFLWRVELGFKKLFPTLRAMVIFLKPVSG